MSAPATGGFKSAGGARLARTMKGKFRLKELPTPTVALKQGCSCGGSVLVKKTAKR